MSAPGSRTEHDLLGDKRVPDSAYWGVHTARALENFAVSGFPIGRHRGLVAALGAVKQAAARANHKLGLLDDTRAGAIERACAQVRAGDLDEEFVVDVVQGGAGTSTNMNANEVIANRALELMGAARGDYRRLSPNDHVNRSQSTNDVYPTAVRLAVIAMLDGLNGALGRLIEALAAKAAEHADVVKVGRTQLQDAVPMTVGQELRGWAVTLGEERPRIADARALLCEVNLGATAIGTGITTAPGYAADVVTELASITGLPLVGASDLVEATFDTGAFVQASAMLKRTAIKVSKICNDLRLLSSGPQAGLGELRLPPRQAGSSIMPGKVNPVIPEMVNQVSFAVAGNDVAITMAAEGGQLQLNPFEPLIAHLLLQGGEWLASAVDTLTSLCISGLEVDRDRLAEQSARSVGVVTALIPHIGYAAATELAQAALAGEGDIRALVRARGILDESELVGLLAPESLTGP
ncbi:MAG: aspartate ammonia-lyase [Nocardioides sp.]|uniref:aspartate ammonia-lyase n=1 Tax=Nocardioides sp. TaxID=35761 RepID=UPI0039E62A2B